MVWQCLGLLDEGLSHSPANAQFKLLQLLLFCRLGAFEPVVDLYSSLDAKHVQHDTIGSVHKHIPQAHSKFVYIYSVISIHISRMFASLLTLLLAFSFVFFLFCFFFRYLLTRYAESLGQFAAASQSCNFSLRFFHSNQKDVRVFIWLLACYSSDSCSGMLC